VTPKGRRAAEDAADAEACVVGSVITLPLVVALVIALSFEAIRQFPSASVFDHEKAKTRGLCTFSHHIHHTSILLLHKSALAYSRA
jgi:hypothetical protein